jgi:hypothetical protein
MVKSQAPDPTKKKGPNPTRIQISNAGTNTNVRTFTKGRRHRKQLGQKGVDRQGVRIPAQQGPE